MDATELVQAWKSRQKEILSNLPAYLVDEYQSLATAVACAEESLASAKKAAPSTNGTVHPPNKPPQLQSRLFAKRVPLAQRKTELIKFLHEKGPASRSQIVAGMKIPNGSLGILLGTGEFEKGEDGKWRAKT